MKDEQEYRYKPAGGLLAGFSCFPMSYIPGIVFAMTGLVCRHRRIVQYSQLTRACIMQSVQFPTFQTISIFLQIRLDDSNYHIFPPYFIKMKWKIEGSSAHKHERTLQFFTFFPAIYSTYNGSAQKKSSRIFSFVRVRITASLFSPANMCIYIMVARRKTTWRLCWLVTARISYGYILPRIGANPAQISSDGAT